MIAANAQIVSAHSVANQEPQMLEVTAVLGVRWHPGCSVLVTKEEQREAQSPEATFPRDS